MNIKQSQRIMRLAMKAKQPFLLVGHSGIGKTQITEQIAKEVFPNHKFVSIFAAQQEMGDFIGIPEVNTLTLLDEEGNKKVSKVTSWARPEWMPHEPCVIFLDELNNARVDVESGMLQLVLEGRIHTHRLHPDSYICGAINPASAEYTTANTMTSALVKRFIVVPFEPENKEFINWAEGNSKFNKTLLGFLKHRPEITGAEKKLDTLIKMEPCPRLLTNAVSNILNVIEEEGNVSDIDLVRDIITCSVGIEAAGAFLGYLETIEKPITFDEIVTNSKDAIKKYNKMEKLLQNDLIAGTHENIISGVRQLHEQVAYSFDYNVSILEFDRDVDKKLVKECIEELNGFVKSGFCGIADKLTNLVAFLNNMETPALFQISHALITTPPFLANDGSLTTEEHHKNQIKRFNSFNSIIFFMYRDDLIKVKGHKGLYDKFMAATKEVNKNKKKEQA